MLMPWFQGFPKSKNAMPRAGFSVFVVLLSTSFLHACGQGPEDSSELKAVGPYAWQQGDHQDFDTHAGCLVDTKLVCLQDYEGGFQLMRVMSSSDSCTFPRYENEVDIEACQSQ